MKVARLVAFRYACVQCNAGDDEVCSKSAGRRGQGVVDMDGSNEQPYSLLCPSLRS